MRAPQLNIRRSQNERLYVMVLWTDREKWLCWARCATPRAAGKARRAAWAYHHADAVETVWATNANHARQRAAFFLAKKRQAREYPKCRNCNAEIARGEEFCGDKCRDAWQAVAGALSQMNELIGDALLPTKRT